MRKRGIIILALFFTLVGFQGCALLGGGTAPTDNSVRVLSPLEKAKLVDIYFLETYKSQFIDAQSMEALGKSGQLSPGQIEVYNKKRQLLIEAEPLIKIFDSLVIGGSVPSSSSEQKINDILNKLLSISSKKIGG